MTDWLTAWPCTTACSNFKSCFLLGGGVWSSNDQDVASCKLDKTASSTYEAIILHSLKPRMHSTKSVLHLTGGEKPRLDPAPGNYSFLLSLCRINLGTYVNVLTLSIKMILIRSEERKNLSGWIYARTCMQLVQLPTFLCFFVYIDLDRSLRATRRSHLLFQIFKNVFLHIIY